MLRHPLFFVVAVVCAPLRSLTGAAPPLPAQQSRSAPPPLLSSRDLSGLGA